MTILTAFVVYSTWAAFVGKDYYAGAGLHRNLHLALLLPLHRQQLRAGQPHLRDAGDFWNFSPALLILIFPLGFRLTCYYYRKAYYRSFWWSPPACAVADAHGSYSGETRFPLILQNIHRYFFWILLIFNVHPDLRRRRRPSSQPGIGIGIGVGHGRALPQRRRSCGSTACRATPAGTSAAARCAPSPSTRSATSSGSS